MSYEFQLLVLKAKFLCSTIYGRFRFRRLMFELAAFGFWWARQISHSDMT